MDISFNEVLVRTSTFKSGYPVSVQLFDRGYSEGTMHLDWKHAVSLAEQLNRAIAANTTTQNIGGSRSRSPAAD